MPDTPTPPAAPVDPTPQPQPPGEGEVARADRELVKKLRDVAEGYDAFRDVDVAFGTFLSAEGWARDRDILIRAACRLAALSQRVEEMERRLKSEQENSTALSKALDQWFKDAHSANDRADKAEATLASARAEEQECHTCHHVVPCADCGNPEWCGLFPNHNVTPFQLGFSCGKWVPRAIADTAETPGGGK